MNSKSVALFTEAFFGGVLVWGWILLNIQPIFFICVEIKSIESLLQSKMHKFVTFSLWCALRSTACCAPFVNPWFWQPLPEPSPSSQIVKCTKNRGWWTISAIMTSITTRGHRLCASDSLLRFLQDLVAIRWGMLVLLLAIRKGLKHRALVLGSKHAKHQ